LEWAENNERLKNILFVNLKQLVTSAYVPNNTALLNYLTLSKNLRIVKFENASLLDDRSIKIIAKNCSSLRILFIICFTKLITNINPLNSIKGLQILKIANCFNLSDKGVEKLCLPDLRDLALHYNGSFTDTTIRRIIGNCSALRNVSISAISGLKGNHVHTNRSKNVVTVREMFTNTNL